MSACILTALWALLAALGRCGVVLAALGSCLVSLGALFGPSRPLCGSCATLRVISPGSTHLSSNLQQFRFTSAAEGAPTAPHLERTRRSRRSSAEDPFKFVTFSNVIQRTELKRKPISRCMRKKKCTHGVIHPASPEPETAASVVHSSGFCALLRVSLQLSLIHI